jgi:hypothetical protein
MLRRIVGIVAVAGVFTLAPVSMSQSEPGQLPLPEMSELQCAEADKCCLEVGSICLVDDKQYPNQRSTSGKCNE